MQKFTKVKLSRKCSWFAAKVALFFTHPAANLPPQAVNLVLFYRDNANAATMPKTLNPSK